MVAIILHNIIPFSGDVKVIRIDPNEERFYAMNTIRQLKFKKYTNFINVVTDLLLNTGNEKLLKQITEIIKKIENMLGSTLPRIQLTLDNMHDTNSFTKSKNPKFEFLENYEYRIYEDRDGNPLIMRDTISTTSYFKKHDIIAMLDQAINLYFENSGSVSDRIRFTQQRRLIE